MPRLYRERHKLMLHLDKTQRILIIVIVFIIAATFLFALFNKKFKQLPTILIPKEKKVVIKEPAEIAIGSFNNSSVFKNPEGQLASFTELFSGEGWRDKVSTIHRDDLNTLISFPLKYDFTEITASSTDYTLIMAQLEATSTATNCLANRCLSLQDH